MPYFQVTVKKGNDTATSVKVKFSKPDGYDEWKSVSFKNHTQAITLSYDEESRKVKVGIKVNGNELGGHVTIPQNGGILKDKIKIDEVNKDDIKILIQKDPNKPFTLEGMYKS